MNNRHQQLRGAAGHAAPLVVLRWAALLAVLMWVLPVCTHDGEKTFGVPAASVQGSTVSPATVQPAAGHACPDMEHGPGDAHCRPATEFVVGTAPSVPVPSLHAADVTVAVQAPGSPPARGAPGVLVPSPGIHHLQIQRI
ncbi:hypothetical protein ACLQ2D_02105 [Streptomyces sp. DT199]|uniref:hypothetical protein n=1 Tax=Streptomyces sp. DT199 TaxID=3393421 RepID=UPI003CF08096